jgi:quercetin dioxygenase-like cupin family protein
VSVEPQADKNIEGESAHTTSIDTAVAEESEWGSIRWLCNDAIRPGAGLTVGFVQINPGMANPRHFHPNTEELLFLIEGELDHAVGDDVVHLTAGMTVHIPAGVEHQGVNRGTSVARMVVSYPTGDRQTVVRGGGSE